MWAQSSPIFSWLSALLSLTGELAYFESYSSMGLAERARLTCFLVFRVVLKPRFTHFSRSSMCETFSILFLIILPCLVAIRSCSRSLIFFNKCSSSCSFLIICSLTLRSFRFSRTFFFSMSSTRNFLSSYFSMSSWFWARTKSSTYF